MTDSANIRHIAILINTDVTAETQEKHQQNLEVAIQAIKTEDPNFEIYAMNPKPMPSVDHYYAPSSSALQQMLADVQSDDNDVVVFYMTGHGEADSIPIAKGDHYSANALIQQMNAMHYGSRFIASDQCFGGNMVRELANSKTSVFTLGSPGELVFCEMGAKYFWSTDTKVSDLNSDGSVTLQERFAAMILQSPDIDEMQTPIFYPISMGPMTLSGQIVNQPDPKVQQVSTEDDLNAALSQLQPGQIAFVAFSADWCSNCPAYIEHFEELSRQQQYGNSIMIVAKDTKGSLKKYFDDHGITSVPRVAIVDSKGKMTVLDPEKNEIANPIEHLQNTLMTDEELLDQLMLNIAKIPSHGQDWVDDLAKKLRDQIHLLGNVADLAVMRLEEIFNEAERILGIDGLHHSSFSNTLISDVFSKTTNTNYFEFVFQRWLLNDQFTEEQAYLALSKHPKEGEEFLFNKLREAIEASPQNHSLIFNIIAGFETTGLSWIHLETIWYLIEHPEFDLQDAAFRALAGFHGNEQQMASVLKKLKPYLQTEQNYHPLTAYVALTKQHPLSPSTTKTMNEILINLDDYQIEDNSTSGADILNVLLTHNALDAKTREALFTQKAYKIIGTLPSLTDQEMSQMIADLENADYASATKLIDNVFQKHPSSKREQVLQAMIKWGEDMLIQSTSSIVTPPLAYSGENKETTFTISFLKYAGPEGIPTVISWMSRFPNRLDEYNVGYIFSAIHRMTSIDVKAKLESIATQSNTELRVIAQKYLAWAAQIENRE